MPSMIVESPRGWVPLEDRFYERRSYYSSLKWPLTPALLSTSVSALAPNGGPIALVPDFGWAVSGFALAIYSLSGRLLKQYVRVRERIPMHVRAVAVGWSKNDVLTIIYDDGGIVRVSLGSIKQISQVYHLAGDVERDERIFDATVLTTGDVVARGVSGRVYRLSHDNSTLMEGAFVPPPTDGILSTDDAAASRAAARFSPSSALSEESSPSPASQPVVRNTIIGIAPEKSSFRVIETLILGDSGSLFKISSAGADQLVYKEPISQVTVSANGKFLAFVIAGTNSLVVSTVDMSSVIARVDLTHELASEIIGDSREPHRIAWVGSDAIAAFYATSIVLIGPRGKVAVLPTPGNNSSKQLLVTTEEDGLRVLSAHSLELLQLVPAGVASVFTDENHSSYKLLRASGASIIDYFVSPDTGAGADPLTRYELISSLRDLNMLRDAARICAEAALLVDDPIEQKALLNATSYAYRFASVLHKVESQGENGQPTHSSRTSKAAHRRLAPKKLRDEDLVPTAVALLRVINAVRPQSVGVPLTKKQLELMGLSGLVARLSRYGEHSVALQLAAYGDISPTHILEQWAVFAISSDKNSSDVSLTTRIIERFEAVEKHMLKDLATGRRGGSLPYVCAAEAAFALGRPKCADLLLRKEHRPAPKVAMYMKMERESQAVIAAVASSDPELVLDVLFKVLDRKSLRETAKMLRTVPAAIGNRAVDLLANHFRQLGNLNKVRQLYLDTGRVREAALVDVGQKDLIEDDQQRVKALEDIARSIGRGRYRRTCYFEVQSAQHAADVAKCSLNMEKNAKLQSGSLSRSTDSQLLLRAIKDIKNRSQRREMLKWLRQTLRIPERRFFWVCLEAMGSAGDFESIEELSQSADRGRQPPIGLMPFVDACLKYDRETEAVKYANKIPDLRDRARALARCGLGREATELALKLRNKQLLDEVAELASLHAMHPQPETKD